jgi:hypothetical protein
MPFVVVAAGALVVAGAFVSMAAEAGAAGVVIVAAGAGAAAGVFVSGAGAAAAGGGVLVSVLGAEFMSEPLLQPVRTAGKARAARQKGRMGRDFIVLEVEVG